MVERPAEGFKNDGAVGFMKGMLTGTAGLFVKPIAGTMDLISKTSQGIENSSKSRSELKADERLRPPRPFYGPEKVIREYDVAHANLLIIAPRLRYRLPEMPDELFNIDTSCFHNAWILEEGTEFYEWSVLLLTNEKIIRIVRYNNVQAFNEDTRQNRKLRDTVHLKKLIQIYSVNDLCHMKKIELYEGRMLDIEFEDTREIIQINDLKDAEQMKM